MATQMSIASFAPVRDLSTVVRWVDDLPKAAHDSRVTVRTDLDAYTVGCCGACWGREETPANWRIEYSITDHGTVQHVDVCGVWCAQEKLTELLERAWYSHRVYGLTLRLPAEFAPESDELANLAEVRCEGLPGCDAPVCYVVEFADRTHKARRECACGSHLPGLIDYAERFGDGFTPCTVSRLPVSERIAVAA
jgi:hypothetical protein